MFSSRRRSTRYMPLILGNIDLDLEPAATLVAVAVLASSALL